MTTKGRFPVYYYCIRWAWPRVANVRLWAYETPHLIDTFYDSPLRARRHNPLSAQLIYKPLGHCGGDLET